MRTTTKGFAAKLIAFLLSTVIAFGVVSVFPATAYADAPPMLWFYPDNNYGANGIGALVYKNESQGQGETRFPQNTAIEELGGGSYSWDYNSRVLTLNSVNFTTRNVFGFKITGWDGPIEINLIGDNSFTTTNATAPDSLNVDNFTLGMCQPVALFAGVDVIVTGSGSLTLNSMNGNGLCTYSNESGSKGPKSFKVKSGTVEIIGGARAVCVPTGGYFGAVADEYTHWVNSDASAPLGGGTSYPFGATYSHNNNDKYIKIDVSNVLPKTHKTVRFATTRGRLVWFENIGQESEGPVMPLIAPANTSIAELGGGSYSWDNATRTLTLTNIKFTTDGDQAFIISPHENKSDDPLNPSKPITLKLSGANSFITADLMPGGLALHSELDIDVSGDGSLTLGCANGTGLRPVIAYNNATLARSFIISSGTVEIYGGTQAVDVPSWKCFSVSAQAYQYWANSGSAQFPGGGAAVYPGAAYKYNSDSKYVKIEASTGPDEETSHNTVRFATTTGRLVWFVGGIPESKGAVMPPIGQPYTPMPELGGGWYAWDSAARVLTLANVHFVTNDIQAFIISPYENEHSDPKNPEKPIFIKLVGNNSFVTTYEEPPVGLGGHVAPSMFSGGLALHSELDITVTGDGTLYLGGGNGTGLLSVTADDAHTPTSFKVASGTTEVSGGVCAVRVPAGGSFGPSAASYAYLANAASPSAPIGNMTAYPGSAAYTHSNKYKYVMITAPYWSGGYGWTGGGYTYSTNAPSINNPDAPSPNQSQGMPSDAISKLMPPTSEVGEKVAATVSNNTLVLNGEEIIVPAVKIDDWNWIRARDLAVILNGTRKQFGIHWNAALNTASITSGEPYEMSGGEMGALYAGSLDTVASPQNFVLDGRMVRPAAYNVNGNNFVRLRDMAILLNFGLQYDDKSGEATFDLDGGYTE